MISIVIPIYNAETYLPACLDSLLAQTERDIQLVLVDDGSTDNSLSIAASYARREPRITLLTQPHAGQSVARNKGLQYVRGEFIAFVDADDALLPDWCARHLAAIHGVDYVQSGYRRKRVFLPRHRYQFTSPCMRLYRRNAIRGLCFAEGMIYEDVLFSADLWLRRLKCRTIPYAGYLYTVNPHSTTSIPHPADENRVMAALNNKKKGQPLIGQFILLFTIFRLKLHFLRQ